MTVELATDTYWTAKVAVEEAIRALSLRDLSGGVYNQISPDESNMQFPCVIVTIEGNQEKPDGGDTQWKYTIYPVNVVIGDRTEAALRHDRERQYLEWRKKIIDTFDRTRILATQYAPCTVSYLDVFKINTHQFMRLALGLVVNVPIAELRKKASNG